jgi:hypothetical protein
MFAMRQHDPPLPRVGGEDIRRGIEGKIEMKFMVPMQFLGVEYSSYTMVPSVNIKKDTMHYPNSYE